MGMTAGIEQSLRERVAQLRSRIEWAESVGREGVQVDSDREELPVVRQMIAYYRRRQEEARRAMRG